jgi:hypothetical protein
MNFRAKIEELLDLYNEIKRDIKHKDKHFYERWKAGGFLIDNDIISMYPNIESFLDTLSESDEIHACYKNGLCPECSEKIPENVTEGDFCQNCSHEFSVYESQDILDSYEDKLCPDCSETIPEDVVDGQSCENCGHVFTKE